MKAIMACVLFSLVSGFVAASGAPTYFQVHLEIKRDDVIVAKPSAIVTLGTPAQITIDAPAAADGTKVKYTVLKSELDASGKRIDTLDLQYFDKTQGNWVLRSAPSAEIYDGEEASIEAPYYDAASSSRRVKVTVTATLVDNKKIAAMFGGKLPTPSACPPGSAKLPVIGPIAAKVGNPPNSSPKTSNDRCVNCQCNSGQTMTCCGAIKCCDEVFGGCCGTHAGG